MPKTLAKPKDRPGTELEGLDLLLSQIYRRSFPDFSGRDLGLVWAAYRDENGFKVYVLGGDGDLLTRTLLRSRRRRRVQWHRAGSEHEILDVLWKLYWRTHDPERPLEDLQEWVRKETNRRCRHEQYQQRHDAWMERQTVQTEERRGGGTMNWIE
jgi:hypothetical protein